MENLGKEAKTSNAAEIGKISLKIYDSLNYYINLSDLSDEDKETLRKLGWSMRMHIIGNSDFKRREYDNFNELAEAATSIDTSGRLSHYFFRLINMAIDLTRMSRLREGGLYNMDVIKYWEVAGVFIEEN